MASGIHRPMEFGSKYLIIRLSSLGDIVQAMEVPRSLLGQNPAAEVHWVVREDFAELVKAHPYVQKTWVVQRKEGWWGLLRLCRQLKNENYDIVYDAHNNLRSHIISWTLFFMRGYKVLFRRSKHRFKRFLLFKLGKNYFPQPFRGMESFLAPLRPLNLSLKMEPHPLHLKAPSQDISEDCLTLVPSAAWALKRWPLDYWKELIDQLDSEKFVVLGGPGETFGEELQKHCPHRVVNLSGQLTWVESAWVIRRTKMTISADTGALHLADFLGKPNMALIGPTAFGYPTRPRSQVLEVPLKCRPCTKDGRGHCKNKTYKKCLMDITPQMVSQKSREILREGP